MYSLTRHALLLLEFTAQNGYGTNSAFINIKFISKNLTGRNSTYCVCEMHSLRRQETTDAKKFLTFVPAETYSGACQSLDNPNVYVITVGVSHVSRQPATSIDAFSTSGASFFSSQLIYPIHCCSSPTCCLRHYCTWSWDVYHSFWRFLPLSSSSRWLLERLYLLLEHSLYKYSTRSPFRFQLLIPFP